MPLKINKEAFRVARESLSDLGTFNNITLEPGRYQAYVKKARIVSTDKGDQVVFDIFVPTAAEGAGGLISIWQKTTEESLPYLLKDLATLGFDPEAIDSGKDIEEAIEQLNQENPVIKLKAVLKSGYTNYYIDQLLSDLTKEDIIEGGNAETETETETEVEVEEEKPVTKTKAVSAKVTPAKTTKAAVKPVKTKTKPEEDPTPEDEPAEEEIEAEAEAEVEEEPSGGEETVVEKGLKCKGLVQGKFVNVEITEVNEEEDFIKIKDLAKGGKVWKFKASQMDKYLKI